MDIIEFDFNNIDPLKDYIYVLQLIDDRYYIGRSQNVLYRIEQHFNGDGSVYTKKFKPLKVVEIVEETTNEDERNKTIEYIKKYTWEKVRGYVWCRIDYKNPVKIDNMILERTISYDEMDEKIKQLYCLDNKKMKLYTAPSSLALPGSMGYIVEYVCNLMNINVIYEALTLSTIVNEQFDVFLTSATKPVQKLTHLIHPNRSTIIKLPSYESNSGNIIYEIRKNVLNEIKQRFKNSLPL
jgi:predicted GIY-YIG superfamily endonuclease